MRRSNERATVLKEELRKRFKSPREAAKALCIDEKLLTIPRLALDGAKTMKPNRLQAYCVVGAARIFNPQLAMDAKGVDYSKLFTGVTTKTLKARKAQIVADAKKMLKGKTLAKDASIEGLAHLLDQFEHVKEPKSLDESVSGAQHRAMEAAAHGHSNLGIPKNVGEEFSHKDKGKKFADALPAFLKSKGVDESIIKDCMDMMNDEMPENALDEEGEEVNIEVEEAEDEIEQEEGEDGEIEQEEAEDGEIEQEEGEDAHPRGKDKRHGKDKKGGAMDGKNKRVAAKKFVTVDEMNENIERAVGTVQKKMLAVQEAREFVRPYVGELPMALDSAEKIYRSAAEIMGIDDAKGIHASALKTVIKTVGDASRGSQDRMDDFDSRGGDGGKSFAERFGTSRITVMPG